MMRACSHEPPLITMSMTFIEYRPFAPSRREADAARRRYYRSPVARCHVIIATRPPNAGAYETFSAAIPPGVEFIGKRMRYDLFRI